MNKDLLNIDLSKIQAKIAKYANKWVAISAENNDIVASGQTYKEVADEAGDFEGVVLLKVPPLDAVLAP